MKILVTAGPTREALDPVRFLSNRSSGRMGYAVARAAAERGHDVRLVSGPVAIDAPACERVIRVTSADEMLSAVREHLPWCDALVMTAAVADWRPSRFSAEKLKKGEADGITLQLVPTVDILSDVRSLKQGRIFVGFAAETERVVEAAKRKCREKPLDLIVANDVSASDAGFEVDTNRVTLIDPAGNAESLPVMSKLDVGRRLVEWVERQAAALHRA